MESVPKRVRLEGMSEWITNEDSRKEMLKEMEEKGQEIILKNSEL